MRYRLDRYGSQISQPGYGSMRFSRKGNAAKLPQYIIRSAAAIDKTFNEELSRLRTDHW